MNTQNLLHERSSEIPEGLYIELMDKLKIDFEKNKDQDVKVIVINKCIPRFIVYTKQQMIQNIIKESVNLENREEILLKITSRVSFNTIKEICHNLKLPIMKKNPRWEQQQEAIRSTGNIDSVLRRVSSARINTLTVPFSVV